MKQRNMTSIPNNSEYTNPEEFMNTPISVSDAASMFRKKISKNERPLTAEVMRLNNKKVDLWYKEVLIPSAGSSGKLPATSIQPSLQTFIDGYELLAYQQYKDMIPRPSREQIDFWFDLLKNKSVTELYEIGTGTLMLAYTLVTNEIKFHIAEKKLEHVYNVTNNFFEREKIATKQMSLFTGKDLPYGWSTDDVADINEKVSILMSVRITADN